MKINEFLELIGKTPLDNAMIDMLGESIQDFFPHIRPWVMVRVGIVPGDAVSLFVSSHQILLCVI
jgi:hypothetical protein